MIQSIRYAFSMYSVIPCGKMTDEQAKTGAKGMLFAFPLVGLFLGLVQIAVFSVCRFFCLTEFFAGAILTVLPILLTGGIHMDGFMDVSDGIGSWGSVEKKQEILKDSHVGAAAVIRCVIYMLLMYGAYCQIYTLPEGAVLYCLFQLPLIFVLERCVTAYMVLSCPKFSSQGMAATAAGEAGSNGKVLLALQWILFALMLGGGAFLSFFFDYVVGDLLSEMMLWAAAGVLLAIAFFAAKRCGHRCLKEFGGMSGDIAGYTLQMMELFMVMALAVILTLF